VSLNSDDLLTAGVLGAVSTITGEIVSRILLSFGIGKHSLYELTSYIVTINRPSVSMGLIVSCIIGGFIGSAFYYALGRIGRTRLVAKAIAVSLCSWLLAETLFTAAVEGHFIDIRPISDYYVHLSASLGYGATLGLLFKSFLFRAKGSSE